MPTCRKFHFQTNWILHTLLDNRSSSGGLMFLCVNACLGAVTIFNCFSFFSGVYKMFANWSDHSFILAQVLKLKQTWSQIRVRNVFMNQREYARHGAHHSIFVSRKCLLRSYCDPRRYYVPLARRFHPPTPGYEFPNVRFFFRPR